MGKTKIKVKRKSSPPMPTDYGYATPERVNQSGTFTPPKNLNSPGYIQGAVNSEYAPNNAEKSELDKALKPHERKLLDTFVEAALAANARAKTSNIEGGGISKGSKIDGGLPYNPDDTALITWYQRIMGAGEERYKKLAVNDQVKLGMEFYYRIETGEGNGYSLSDIGRVMCRHNCSERIIGGYVAFYVGCVHSIENSERLINLQIRDEMSMRKRKIYFPVDKSF